MTGSIRVLAMLVGLSFSTSIFGQRVEDGWNGLLPFKSTRTDVEKLFGAGKKTNRDRHYQVEYKNDSGNFRVDYSVEPCSPSSDSLDRYNLPAATILRYEVRLIRPIPLEELTFDVNRFERTVTIYGSNDEPRAISYLQGEFDRWKAPNEAAVGYGIEIQVTGSGEGELAAGFVYGLPYDRTKFKCSNVTN